MILWVQASQVRIMPGEIPRYTQNGMGKTTINAVIK